MSDISRRDFLKTGAAALAGLTIAPSSILGKSFGHVPPSDKLNIAALGNVVPQLHVHIIARRTSDAAWPRPVWGVVPPLAHDPQEIETFIAALRRKIWLS